MEYTSAEFVVLPLALIAMLGLASLLRFVTLGKSERIQNLPFIIIAALVLLMEFSKQMRNLRGGYDTWGLPFHYCSTFAVWLPLAEFTRGNFRKRMKNVAFVATFCLLTLFYFGPRPIIGNACANLFQEYSAFHTFFYHHLALFYCILGIFFKRFTPERKDGWLWITCMSVYFSLALTFAFTFDRNFFNILYSDVPFLESFRLAFGQIPYLFLLSSLLLFGGASVFWITARIAEKRKTVIVNETTVA